MRVEQIRQTNRESFVAAPRAPLVRFLASLLLSPISFRAGSGGIGLILRIGLRLGLRFFIGLSFWSRIRFCVRIGLWPGLCIGLCLGLRLCLGLGLGLGVGQRLKGEHRERPKRRRLRVGPARVRLPGRFSSLGLDDPGFIGGLGVGVGVRIGLRICSRLGLGLGFRFAVDLRCPSELPSWPGAGGIDPCHHNRGLQERPETLQY